MINSLDVPDIFLTARVTFFKVMCPCTYCCVNIFQAICSHDDRTQGNVTCTCPREKGLGGNGYRCYGNLLDEIAKLPEMQYNIDLVKVRFFSGNRNRVTHVIF